MTEQPKYKNGKGTCRLSLHARASKIHKWKGNMLKKLPNFKPQVAALEKRAAKLVAARAINNF